LIHTKEYIIAFLLLFAMPLVKSQKAVDLNATVSMNAKNITIDTFIEYLDHKWGIQTGYFNDISAFDKMVGIRFHNVPLKVMLDSVFHPHHIQYIFVSNKLILKEEIPDNEQHILQGSIFDQHTQQPLPYCAVQLKHSFEGCITDKSGRYYMELDEDDAQDTLIISMLGYETDTVSVNHLLPWTDYKIYLKPVSFPIPGVEINSEPGDFERLGNKGFLTAGSIYLDTHGQQTALFIENPEERAGRVVKVSYYLSKKGNTTAPFRIRIYKKDSVIKAPGEDLLRQMVVVSPDIDKGWYDINVARFNIPFPKEGVFIAIEGIYPDDFDQVYTGQDFIEGGFGYSSVDEIDDVDLVSFGQRLGYNRKGDNNTWHYSITGKWFQVDKSNFNAMIATEIKFYEDETN
jgi:hypothetical protein